MHFMSVVATVLLLCFACVGKQRVSDTDLPNTNTLTRLPFGLKSEPDQKTQGLHKSSLLRKQYDTEIPNTNTLTRLALGANENTLTRLSSGANKNTLTRLPLGLKSEPDQKTQGLYKSSVHRNQYDTDLPNRNTLTMLALGANENTLTRLSSGANKNTLTRLPLGLKSKPDQKTHWLGKSALPRKQFDTDLPNTNTLTRLALGANKNTLTRLALGANINTLTRLALETNKNTLTGLALGANINTLTRLALEANKNTLTRLPLGLELEPEQKTQWLHKSSFPRKQFDTDLPNTNTLTRLPLGLKSEPEQKTQWHKQPNKQSVRRIESSKTSQHESTTSSKTTRSRKTWSYHTLLTSPLRPLKRSTRRYKHRKSSVSPGRRQNLNVGKKYNSLERISKLLFGNLTTRLGYLNDHDFFMWYRDQYHTRKLISIDIANMSDPMQLIAAKYSSDTTTRARHPHYYEPYWNNGSEIFYTISTHTMGMNWYDLPWKTTYPLPMATRPSLRHCSPYCLATYEDFGKVCAFRLHSGGDYWRYTYREFDNICDMEYQNCANYHWRPNWRPLHRGNCTREHRLDTDPMPVQHYFTYPNAWTIGRLKLTDPIQLARNAASWMNVSFHPYRYPMAKSKEKGCVYCE